MDGDSNKKHRKEYQRRRKDHTERKKACGGKKDPLTRESYASNFDYIDDLEAQEAHTVEEIEEVRAIMKKSNEEGDENGKTADNSKDNVIAIE
jgi:5'-deoxynucleotidase YfbR-like HD superfamily hydrolase